MPTNLYDPQSNGIGRRELCRVMAAQETSLSMSRLVIGKLQDVSRGLTYLLRRSPAIYTPYTARERSDGRRKFTMHGEWRVKLGDRTNGYKSEVA